MTASGCSEPAMLPEFLQLLDTLVCLACRHAPWALLLPGVIFLRWIGK